MKKNGFTLVELLAVLVIISVLSLIAIPNVVGSINESKKNLYAEQVTRIIEATNTYIQDNDNLLPEAKLNSEPTVVTIKELQQAGLLKSEDVKNPLSSKNQMSGTIKVIYNLGYNQYNVIYCDFNDDPQKDYSKYYYKDKGMYESVKTRCNIEYETVEGKRVPKTLLGDLNEDGVINSTDPAQLGNFLAGYDKTYNMYLTDISFDGKIDNDDLQLLLQIVSKGSDTF